MTRKRRSATWRNRAGEIGGVTGAFAGAVAFRPWYWGLLAACGGAVAVRGLVRHWYAAKDKDQS